MPGRASPEAVETCRPVSKDCTACFQIDVTLYMNGGDWEAVNEFWWS